jgi:hypothetical protein
MLLFAAKVDARGVSARQAEIAEALSARGIHSPRGGGWYTAGVRRMIGLASADM